MTHILITRFHYPLHDPRFRWRLAYYRSMVLPRLLQQTDQNFVIGIWCNPAHDKIFKSLSDKIIPFHVKSSHISYRQTRLKKYFYDFNSWNNVVGLEKYDIQSGLDSDDLVSLDYIETINKAFASKTERTHLSFQPLIFNAKTLTTKDMWNKYGSRHGSAFFSLFQPDKEDYHFIYETSHLRLWKFAKESITLPAGKCWATVHYINESTGVIRK